MLLELPATVRDLGRMAEIAAVLARYGFADAVDRLGLRRALERAGRALNLHANAADARLGTPERLRRALQELGPAFVKLGQILATRVDLFPPGWIAEFEKLRDQAAPSDPAAVRAQLVEDLGAEPETVFREFEAVPFAAGSIAQVHRARLQDGTPVVVKVRRPGVASIVEADLSLLARIAHLAQAHLSDFARFRPVEVVRQLARTMRTELDLAAEARSAERIAESFRGDPSIVVPRMHWQWTRERVNVQDCLDGIPSHDLAAVDRAGLDRAVLARRGARAMLRMVIEDGFFHADPHSGNVFYLPGERVAFVDFGMTGRLTQHRRDELVQLLDGLAARDASKTVDVLLEWSDGLGLDEPAISADIEAFIDRYHGRALSEMGFGAMLDDLVQLLQEHKLALPPDLALVLKVAATLEAAGRELDPGFDMVAEAEPFLRAASLARASPRAFAQRGWRVAKTVVAILDDLPGHLRRIVRSLRHGKAQIRIDAGLDRFGVDLNRAANRLTVGVVTAALIIGSSIVMTVDGGPTLFGLPFFGLAGFLASLASGAWLVFSIWRSGRAR